MKIEKISDTQIRCTLTHEDLEDRNIRLSELAYGSDKAKQLFHDMMQQAYKEFGFEADNIPLMIEAVPLKGDSVLLIVTKVENPEELDTRFSKFSPFRNNEKEDTLHFDGADSILDIFQKLTESKLNASTKKPEAVAKEETPKADSATVNLIQLFLFETLDQVIDAAHVLSPLTPVYSSLYHYRERECYALILQQNNTSPEDFNKLCNVLSEFGSRRSFSEASEAHLIEHADKILDGNALEKLAEL